MSSSPLSAASGGSSLSSHGGMEGETAPLLANAPLEGLQDRDFVLVFRRFLLWPLLMGSSFFTAHFFYWGGDICLALRYHPFPYLGVTLMCGSLFLLGYLHNERMANLLGRHYLWLGIVGMTLVPMIGFSLQLYFDPSRLMRHKLLLGTPFLFFLLPFLLVSWRYTRTHILFFCLGTFLLDLFLWWSLVEERRLFWEVAQWGAQRTVSFALVGFLVSHLVQIQHAQRTELWRRHQQLQHYAASLEALATSRERMRIARELHDTMAHALSAQTLQLEGVKALWSIQPEEAKKMLESALDTTRTGLIETRRALRSLRAAPLEDLGLCEAIREEALEMAAKHKLLFTDEINALGYLAPMVEQALYRTAQEAFRNIGLHAKASRFLCRLRRDERLIELLIEDDGCGFSSDKAPERDEQTEQTERWGLIGMKERMRAVGGLLSIQSSPQGGTKISATFSLG